MAYRFRRGRGQFTAPTSRSGKAYTYSGRRVVLKGDHFQINWNGPEVVAQVLNAIENGLRNLSDNALAYMQGIVPVDTGALRESCYVVVDAESNRIRVVIGASQYYAVYVELGTSSHSAQPFIRPTYDYVVQNLHRILSSEVKRRAR